MATTKLEDPLTLDTRICVCALNAWRNLLKHMGAEDDPVVSIIPKRLLKACGSKPRTEHNDNTTYSLLKQVTKAKRTESPSSFSTEFSSVLCVRWQAEGVEPPHRYSVTRHPHGLVKGPSVILMAKASRHTDQSIPKPKRAA